MSRRTIRYASHKAMMNLEWIERHVLARPNTREVREHLLNEIEDLRNYLIKRASGATFDHPLPRRRSFDHTQLSLADSVED